MAVHRLSGQFGVRALAQLSRLMERHWGERLLVQYVPHAFGLKAMNLLFCLWLYRHTRVHGGAWVMFHEVNFEFLPGHPTRYRLLDAMTKIMARLVARSAAQIFVSTPMWSLRLRRYLKNDCPYRWIPVPSSIAVVTRWRANYRDEAPLCTGFWSDCRSFQLSSAFDRYDATADHTPHDRG